MNTNAVYRIHEDGKEFFFHSKYAGGFSYPFEVAGYLNGLKYALQKSNVREQNICVAPLLSQMKGTCCFSDSLKETLLFTEIPKETALSDHTTRDTPFYITLDVNRYTVAFHFSQQFPELKDMIDIAFPCFDPKSRYSGGRFMEEALSRQAESSDMPLDQRNELIFRELIEQAAAEQKCSHHYFTAPGGTP